MTIWESALAAFQPLFVFILGLHLFVAFGYKEKVHYKLHFYKFNYILLDGKVFFCSLPLHYYCYYLFFVLVTPSE